MASTRALNLPDILRITFAFLNSKSLFACAQVNSIWADEATDILWRTPPVSALVSLVPSGRAQMYANKTVRFITEYNRPDDMGPLQAFPKLSFPRLKIVACFRADLALYAMASAASSAIAKKLLVGRDLWIRIGRYWPKA